MSDAFIGEIQMFAGNFPPKNWLFCDGQIMNIASNTALFSLLGTTFGGNGTTTFALPNLQGRVPLHAGQGPGLSNRFLGEVGGASTVTLTTSAMPAHVHAPSAGNGAGNQASPANAYWAQSSVRDRQYRPPGTPDVAMANMLDPAGGGQPHDNMAPYLAVSYIIAIYGIYPSRP